MYSKNISDTTPSTYYAYFISKDNIDKIKEIKDNKAKKDEILKNIPDNIIEKNNKLSFTKLNDIVNVSYNGSILDLNNNISNYNNDKLNLEKKKEIIFDINNCFGLNEKNTDYNILQKLEIKKEIINNENVNFLYNDVEISLINDSEHHSYFHIGYFYDYDGYTVNNDKNIICLDLNGMNIKFSAINYYMSYNTNTLYHYSSLSNLEKINPEGEDKLMFYVKTCYNLFPPYTLEEYIEINEENDINPDDNNIHNNNLVTVSEILNSIDPEHPDDPYIFKDIPIYKVSEEIPADSPEGFYLIFKSESSQKYCRLVYYKNNEIMYELNPIFCINFYKKINDEEPIIYNNYYQLINENNNSKLKYKIKKQINNKDDLISFINSHMFCEISNIKNTNDKYNIIDNSNYKTNNISSNNLFFNDEIILDKSFNTITLSSLNPFNSNQYLRLIKSFINDKPKLNDITTNNYYLTIPERFRPNYVFKTLIPIECYYINSSLIPNSSSSSTNNTQTYNLVYNDNDNATLILNSSSLYNNYGEIKLNDLIIKKTYVPLIVMPNGFVYIDTSSVNLIINEQLELNKIHSTEDNNIEYENLYVLRKINICAFSFNYDNTLNINKKDFDYYNNFENNNPSFVYQLTTNNHPVNPDSSSSGPG